MTHPPYSFNLFDEEAPEQIDEPRRLAERGLGQRTRSLVDDAPRFVPGAALAQAIKTAICLGEPLLITGEPGTGKTQAAYYAAWKLRLGDVLHFQVKSDSTAKDLLYDFDTVRYFQDASMKTIPIDRKGDPTDEARRIREDYVEKKDLWIAFEEAKNEGIPRVVLIDEIDKAPRDFPNDLLHELGQMEIRCPETGEVISVPANLRPLVFITSNSERRLPEPFLRRCVYHHIQFDRGLLDRVIETRRDEFAQLGDGFLDLAKERFLGFHEAGLIKAPSTGELLDWLRVMATAADVDEDQLREASDDPAKLPYLCVLLKNRQDLPKKKR